ncbi:MAG TPA: hypothetical protein VM143_02115 [Acidimicrobiales bacterium]|nr:hypothetical protein [Acidimicrobiales bacterium]
MHRRLVDATVLLTVVASIFTWLAALPAAAVPITTAPALSRPSTGYWLAAADGGVFTYGDAEFHGSAGEMKLQKPIVGMAATSTGSGYWMVAADGGVFAFGGVLYHGSMGAQRLNKPIVAMAATPTGQGYWLVAGDGGIFAFGDAGYFGSTGDLVLNQPIVGMTSTPTGRGYWLVARDGGIFTFGDAAFFGSTGSIKLNQPIVTMAASATGNGYWMAAADGGMFTFGDAEFLGSTGSIKLNKPIVGMTPTGLGNGYWLVASDGGIFTFGDAPFLGSAGGSPLNSPIVAVAPRAKPGRVESAIFYYPWYGNGADDPQWFHWNNDGHKPPDDIASNFFPSRGAYSSNDLSVVQSHMADLRAAGVDEVVVSWWGPRSFEDRALPGVVSAAHQHGLRVAIHVEPYPGRTPDLVQRDVLALSSRYGIREYWIYLSDGPSPESWQTLTSVFQDMTFWAHGHAPSNGLRGLFQAYAARAGFDGVYTYDPVQYAPAQFETFCTLARARGLRCSPSVSPGYDGRRGVPDPVVLPRLAGDRYDGSWTGAFAAGADVISITSYNEWHEGTQIEPARAGVCLKQGQPPYCYTSYDGDYGLTGAAAETVYVGRTRFWTDALRR